MDLELDDLWEAKYKTLEDFLFHLIMARSGNYICIDDEEAVDPKTYFSEILKVLIEKNPSLLEYSFVRILANATDFNKALDVAWDDIEEALRDARRS